MECKVISISRSLGAGGEEIGRLLAQELGFRYADEEIIVRAAERAGVSPQAVAAAERTPGLITRILEAMARTPPDPEGWAASALALADAPPDYAALIGQVIVETAREGNVVIVAHGASIPLAGVSGLLRVLVTASPETRVARLARETDLSERAAGKAVKDSDRQRREYLRRFYGLGRELPTHYDLVLNTDLLPPPLAAQVAARAARG